MPITTYTWIGTSGDWSTATDWTGGPAGTVPDGKSNAAITASGTETVTVSSNQAVNVLTLNDANATLAITNGATLSAYGGLSVSAIVLYGFDESSGTVAHDQQGNHDGTIIGATYTQGITGDALQFGGPNPDYVSVPNSSAWNFGSGDFSIGVWANFSSTPSGSAGQLGDVLVAHDEGGGTTNKWVLDAYSGNLGFHVNNPAAGLLFFAEAPFTPTPGQWYFID
jgi:hypothetical protein